MPSIQSYEEEGNGDASPPMPPDLQALVHDVSRGRITATEAARRAVATGKYLLIGTCLPVDEHVPRLQKYFDLKLGAWIIVGVPGDSEEAPKPVLRATTMASVAVFCALFGDYNQPDQRQQMGLQLGYPRPYFGWDVISEEFDVVDFHAVYEYIQAAQDPSLHGFIDVVHRRPFVYKEEPGQWISIEAAKTLATFPVRNSELPPVREIDYGNGTGGLRSIFGE